MTKNNYLPSFFILGTQKAATTTIHDWLVKHPDINLPKIKETHFFSNLDIYNKGVSWYLKQFPNRVNKNSILTGEIDPSYMYINSTPNRMSNVIKSNDLKFVFILRRPIYRAYSHYLMSKYLGYEELDFLEAIEREHVRLVDSDKSTLTKNLMNYSYLDRGNYTLQINRYIKKFNKAKFLFIDFDKFLDSNSRKSIYSTLCNFLNIKELISIDINLKSNSAKLSKSNYLRDLINKDSIYKQVFTKIITSDRLKYSIKSNLNKINKINISSIDKCEQIDKIISELPEKYIKWNNMEVDSLEKLTRLSLDKWIIN